MAWESQAFVGSPAIEKPTCALRDAAGRVFIGGYAQSKPHSLPDGWLVCLSPTGTVEWTLTPGGLGPDRIEDLAEADSILYFCGSSGSALSHPEDLPPDRRSDFWVGAVDKNTGRLLWQTRWGSPHLDQALTLCVTPYRTLLVGGLTWREPELGLQGSLHILRTTNGEVLQERQWGQAPSLVRKIRPIPGTPYYACIGEQNFRPFVAALDYLGQVYWRTIFQFHRFPSRLLVLYCTQAGQILVGGQYGHTWGISLLNLQGQVVWEALWPPEGPVGAVTDLIEGPEGLLYALGWQYSPNPAPPEQKGAKDVWLAALTPQGQKLWERGFGGPYDENGTSLLSTPSGLILVAQKENRFSEAPPHPDAWLLHLRAVPCHEVPVEVQTDVPSLREKAGRAIRFWVRLPSAYRALRIHWDFGDGSSATGPEVQHVFGEPGSYSVQATLSLAYGCPELPLPPLLLRINRP